MKPLFPSILLVAACLVTTLRAGDSTHTDIGLSKFPITAARANYRFEQPFLANLIGKSWQGVGGDVKLTLETAPAADGGYTFSCEATAGKQLVPGVGRPVQAVLWQCSSSMDAMGSISYEAILEKGTKTGETVVELRDSAMFGPTKVISTREGDKITRELMIGVNENVTTLFQVVAFVGTLSSPPEEGMKIRWVLNGMPHPMIVTKDTDAPRSFTISRDNSGEDSEKEALRLRFIFPGENEAFALPKRIMFMFGGRQVEIIGTEE